MTRSQWAQGAELVELGLLSSAYPQRKGGGQNWQRNTEKERKLQKTPSCPDLVLLCPSSIHLWRIEKPETIEYIWSCLLRHHNPESRCQSPHLGLAFPSNQLFQHKAEGLTHGSAPLLSLSWFIPIFGSWMERVPCGNEIKSSFRPESDGQWLSSKTPSLPSPLPCY